MINSSALKITFHISLEKYAFVLFENIFEREEWYHHIAISCAIEI